MTWSSDPEKSILVLDDDPGICKALTRVLSNRYSVWAVNTIKEAHDSLFAKEFGLIIIDYQLNESMDGITFAEYAKTVSPLSYTVMLTGYSDFELIQRALNEGNVDKFLVKPFITEELLDLADTALAHYSSKREISNMLQSSEGIKMAQGLLTQVFDETELVDEIDIELSGVVISHHSIPVYSRFLNKQYLKKFTDTIFSGFMTAIHMVGQEVFSDETKVDLLKFGEISIYFKFYEQYQFCFIIKHEEEQPSQLELTFFDEFVDDVVVNLNANPEYFNAENGYIEDLDAKLIKLKENSIF